MYTLYILYISYSSTSYRIYCSEKGVFVMVRLRILDILKEQNHTKYWLYKQMNMSYQNFNRLVNNETSSIHFENLDIISKLLNVPVGDLFEQISDDENI